MAAKTVYLQSGQAIISFASALAEDFDKGKVETVQAPGENDSVEIMTWGKDNDLPQQRELLISENNIVPALIEKKRNLLVGSGIMPYQYRYETQPDGSTKKSMEEVEMPPQAEEWLNREVAGMYHMSNKDYLCAAAGELMKHGVFFPEFVRSKDDQVLSIEVKETKHLRAGKKNDKGRITRYYWSGFWGKRIKTNSLETKTTVPMDIYTGEDRKQAKFILPVGDYLLNDGYYPIPTWWGSWEWVELANQIPQFHKSNLQNSYNLRWHIQIPVDYFFDYEKYNAATTEVEKQEVMKSAAEREKAFMNDINKFLAGLNNVGRTVFTKYELDKALGKEYPGIKIEALQYDLKDEALLKLFDKANTAQITSQGLHPTLANIETQGRLSSGTEMRNALLMWLIINTPGARAMILKPLELVKKINGWPADVHYCIRDYELTALSENGAGMQQSETPMEPA